MSNNNENNYQLILNNETFLIPKDIKEIGKVSEKINHELIENGKYEVTSNVQNSIFKSFLDYWQNGKVPLIDSSTKKEYQLLIDEFGILHELLSQSKNDLSDDEYYGKKKTQNKKIGNQQVVTNIHEILVNFFNDISPLF